MKPAIWLAAMSPAALERMSATTADVVFLDFELPDGDALAVIPRMRQVTPETQIILMTSSPTPEHAVEAMKLGAYHYVNKPINLDEAVLVVERALETSQLRREVRTLRSGRATD